MPEHRGCGKCRYHYRGCRRCNPTFVPLRAPPRAVCTITVVPFVRTNAAGRVVAQKGVVWLLHSRANVNVRTLVDVYLGSDWRAPPYDVSMGAVLRLTLADSTCVIHVPDLSVTAGEVVAALNVATKATMCETMDAELMANCNLLVFNSTELPNSMPLSTCVDQNIYTVTKPMLLQVLMKL
jgi:hypothetical protein